MTTLWVAGQIVKTEDGGWEMLGVFDTEEAAVRACKEGADFVGPIELNAIAPRETTIWPGSYRPLE